MSVTVTLGVKITYNLNDTPQLRLARHAPIPVAVYASSDECAGASASSSSSTGKTTNKYEGCFAELPLGACLSALKDASPELISNLSFDYSVYVNDPTESTVSASDAGVFVGKGLLSSCLKENSTSSLVFGKVVKDGIRGQSVLVHFVLEKTPRIPQETIAASIPATPSPILPIQQQHPDPSINALLSLLSSASSSIPQSSLIQLQQQPTPDISQLFSALAGCYGLGASFPNLPTSMPPLPVPAPTEVIVIKEEEDDVVEIVGTSSTVPAMVVPEPAAPQRTRRTSLGKENIPPVGHAPAAIRPRTSLPSASLPVPTSNIPSASQPQQQSTKAMSKSKSTSHLPLHLHKFCDPSTITVSRNQTPFLEVPALQPMSALTNSAAPTTVVLSGLASQKKGKELPGPHGNGWYRRTNLPPMTSSDAPVPPPRGSVLQSIVADANGDKDKKGKGKKKRPSDATMDGTAPRKKVKKSNDTVDAVVATSPAKGSTSGLNALGGLGTRVVLPAMSATSPIKPTVVKKITLRHGKSASTKAVEAAGAQNIEEDKKRGAPVTKFRTLNFLSLAAVRPPSTTITSETLHPTFAVPLPMDRKTSVVSGPDRKQSPSLPPVVKVSASSPIISSLGLALPGILSNAATAHLPSRPSTPPPSAKRSPSPPRTPSRRKTSKTDVNLDEDGGSPLFLDSPVKTERKQQAAAVLVPSSPSPTPMARSRLISHCRHLSLEDRDKDSDDVDGQNAKSEESTGHVIANLPMFDFSDLPPSSPPASFPSSSPSVSPRFTLDSVMDGMDEAEAEERMDEDADLDEEPLTQETATITSTFILNNGAPSSSSFYSDATATSTVTSSSSSSSAMPATSDAGNDTNVDLDWSLLADALGMCENTKADVTTPMPMPDESTGLLDFLNALGIVQPAPAVEHQPMELSGSDIFDFAAFNGGYEEPAKVSTAATGGAYEDDGFLSFVTSFGGGTA